MAPPAGAVAGVHKVTYSAGESATAAQLKAAAHDITVRLDSLGASFVHVTVVQDDVILTSATRAISASVLDEVGQTGRLYFRPVLCYAYPETLPTGGASQAPSTGAIPACQSQYLLTASNLHVNTSTGEPANNVGPDPQYSSYPSTSTDAPNYASSTVLLPGLKANGASGDRYVLGPSEMTGRSVASARATLVPHTHQWVVDYRLVGKTGSALWDKVAQENFHAFLGIELDGVVYSAPIIQPTQSSFTSFDGKGEISGGGPHGLTRQDAQKLAQAMNLGALPVTLTLEETQS